MSTRGDSRLLALARILDRVPDEPVKKDGKIVGYNQDRVMHDCGAPACAWGWWMYSSKARFKRLAMGEWRHPIGAITNELAHWGQHREGERDYVSIDEATKEFGITNAEKVELFSGYGCGDAQTGKAAAAYIRAFVKKRRSRS